MTLFNVRLGAWVGNPGLRGDASYRHRGSRYALGPLLSEALARTTDQSRYVYLSDGGHFDNLGLYEMLRRRCRFILFSDATSDPNYVYADLGSVIRKAAVDFGIRISFDSLDLQKRGAPAINGAYCAFGVIDYPEMTRRTRKGEAVVERVRGYLLYLKAGYHGKEEPADIKSYALANPAFPHDATLNQFFAESQFESYRSLGSFIVMQMARDCGFPGRGRDPSLRNFLGRCRAHLRRLSSAGSEEIRFDAAVAGGTRWSLRRL
jgi:hypothetical protein